jgi:hypothetical protein
VDFLLSDLSALRYRWNAEHTQVTMLTPLRERLAVAASDMERGQREPAVAACDRALAGTFRPYLLGAGGVESVRYRIGLYNPDMAKISVGQIPKTKVFSDRAPLDIPQQGLVAKLGGTGPDRVLVVGQRRLVLIRRAHLSSGGTSPMRRRGAR